MKSRVKRIHGNFIGQGGVHFSAKKCCGKCANVMPKGDADGRCYLGLNDLCQRRCYETPLQDRVPVNSGKVIRRGHLKGEGGKVERGF